MIMRVGLAILAALLAGPVLAVEVEWLEIRRLAVGDEAVDLVFRRVGDRTVAAVSGDVPDNVTVTMRF